MVLSIREAVARAVFSLRPCRTLLRTLRLSATSLIWADLTCSPRPQAMTGICATRTAGVKPTNGSRFAYEEPECAPKPPFRCKPETAFTAPMAFSCAMPAARSLPRAVSSVSDLVRFHLVGQVGLTNCQCHDFSVGFAAPLLVNCLTSELINGLKPYIVGWRGYFGFSKLRGSSRTSKRGSVEHLRLYLWRQWRTSNAPWKR